jgi:2-iminobutanoate/2-iminopropanoate deaminase
MRGQRINAPGLARLPAFYVSGTLGTKPDSMELAEGGTGPETAQALRNIEAILQACGASLDDLVKVNVFLADMQTFSAMNEVYLAVMGADPPARITVGQAGLALGAAVEIDGIAYYPNS